MLGEELADDYFETIRRHLKQLRFQHGVLVSAQLGAGNKGVNYVLRKPNPPQGNWMQRMVTAGPRAYSFQLAPRDDNGARALSTLRDRGINLVANALAQSTDHILSFFNMLRTELAFYVGCLNLHGRLAAQGGPVCFPEPAAPDERRYSASGLYDVCLALRLGAGVVGNEVEAGNKDLVIITGANQGGKSTLLRGIGLAQLMMQCGMFVPARTFHASVCERIFTHCKREEDVAMRSGKFDEELSRMSDIIDHVVPDSIVLFNESFAATNEREGSEVARQIVTALVEGRVKVFFVTHQYEFARGFHARNLPTVLFLRAERQADGARTFKITQGQPLQTSYGEDLYKRIFLGATTA
jgi:DNA mismatch repair ATPase MutS